MTTQELRRQIDSHLATYDRPAAVSAALDAVRNGDISILDLHDSVLVPLLVDTGAAWQSGITAVWQEHFASATVRTIVEALYPDVIAQTSAVTPQQRTAVLACPSGEQHDLGMRMLADRFALAGWTVAYLGTDTPAEEIVSAAKALSADMVVLSASTHFNRVHLRDVVDSVKSGLPDVRVAVGGAAFTLDKAWPADELFDTAEIDAPTSGS